MLIPALPPNEEQRLAALYALEMLDTPSDEALDDVVRIAATLSGCPIALVSLIDRDRQWFKAKVGLDACETARDHAFCAHAILTPEEVLLVEDARRDPRFVGNPLVDAGPRVVFYLGIPLRVGVDRQAIGTLCVIDHQPRRLDEDQVHALRRLGRQAERLIASQEAARQLGVALDGLAAEVVHRREAMENALRESEARWKVAIESAGDGLWDWDARTNAVFFSEEWKRQLGYSGDEVGQTLDEWDRRVHPDDREETYAAIHRHFAGETEVYTSVHRLRCKDGSWKWILDRGRVVSRDAEGKPLRVVGTHTDLTERLKAESDLRESQARLLEAQSEAHLGHWHFDLATRRITWSPQVFRNFGLDPAGPAPDYAAFMETIHPEDRPMLDEAVDRAIGTGASYRIEHRIRLPDGGDRWILSSGRRIDGSEGQALALAGTCQDISESVRIREELRATRDAAQAAARAKADFLATMSHEIRTPLNGVLGMTTLLLGTPLDHEQRDYAEAARSSGNALLALLNDILDLSKLDAGRIDLESIPFAPRELVEDTLAMVSEIAQAKGLELYLNAVHDLPAELRGDPGRLRQILVNLVANAVKFTERGEVMVRLGGRRDGGDWLLDLSVRDSGIGIAPEHLDHLFAEFSQADQSIARRFGGTGLGLAISQRLAALMGGRIVIDSLPGAGSSFSVSLRLPIERPAMCQRNLVGLRVVVVDDHPGARDAAVAVLAEAGAGVMPCASLAALGQVLDGGAGVDVVVLDGDLGAGPADVIAGIHDLRRRCGALPPMVFCPTLACRAKADTAGFAAVAVRPLRAAALVQAVERSRVDRNPTGPYPVPTDGSTRRGLAILVAEDHLVSQKVIRTMLTRLGHRVTIAADGKAAVAACAGTRFDLVFMDCQMPELDGFQATAAIRANEGAGPHVPILALTANALGGDRQACLDAGMDDYLTKPIVGQALEQALRRWGATPGS